MLKNDTNTRQIFKDYVMSLFSASLANNQLNGASVGKALAINSMNNFLRTGSLSSTNGIKAGLSNGHHQRIKAADDLSKLLPLLPAWDVMGWAQYRAQQVEYKGSFDGHDWRASNGIIKNHSGTGVTKAPQLWNEGGSGGECYGTFTNPESTKKISNISTFDAWDAAWGFFLDQNDATGTLGHRALVLGEFTSIGWAMPITTYGNDAKSRDVIYSLGTGAKSDVNFGWIKAFDGKSDYTGWLINGKLKELFPDDSIFKGKTHAEIITIITNKLSKMGYAFKLADKTLSYTAAEKKYASLGNQYMKTKPIDSLTRMTVPYNVLGSGTQVMFEDNNYDAWKNNLK